jgi:hypothetical protein
MLRSSQGNCMPTIALVDDDRNILTSVSIALETEGYRIQTYTTVRLGTRKSGTASRAEGLVLYDHRSKKASGSLSFVRPAVRQSCFGRRARMSTTLLMLRSEAIAEAIHAKTLVQTPCHAPRPSVPRTLLHRPRAALCSDPKPGEECFHGQRRDAARGGTALLMLRSEAIAEAIHAKTLVQTPCPSRPTRPSLDCRGMQFP